MARYVFPRAIPAPVRAVACAALIASVPTSLRAGEACPLHDWLANIYQAGEALAEMPPGPRKDRVAVDLAGSLKGADRDRLGRLLSSAGMEDNLSTVEGYVAVLRARLMSLDTDGHNGNAEPNPKAELMASFLDGLECEADPDWSPPEKRSGKKGGHDKSATTFQRDVRAAVIASGGLLALVLCVIAAIMGARAIFSFFERRAAARVPCRMKAVLRAPDGAHAGIAVDISPTGAKLRLARQMDDQARCGFEIGGTSIPARILWSNEHFTGIRFVSPLEREPFEKLLAQHRWSAPAYGQMDQGRLIPARVALGNDPTTPPEPDSPMSPEAQ